MVDNRGGRILERGGESRPIELQKSFPMVLMADSINAYDQIGKKSRADCIPTHPTCRTGSVPQVLNLRDAFHICQFSIEREQITCPIKCSSSFFRIIVSVGTLDETFSGKGRRKVENLDFRTNNREN